MKTWSLRLLRLLNGLLSAVALILTVALVALAAAISLGVSGVSLAPIRHLVAEVAPLVSGQHTDHLAIDVRLDPDRGWLEATATLDVRATDTPRRAFFFLLNPGFTVRDFRVSDATGVALPARSYRLSLFTIVELAEPQARDASVRITMSYAGEPAIRTLGGDSASFRSDRILLGPETFWYPYDAQSFFTLDAAVTLPSRLTLVHNGPTPSRAVRGAAQEIRWSSERPLAGSALIAGIYSPAESVVDGRLYRVFSGPDVELDTQRITTSVAEAFALFSETFGDSGYSQATVVLDREVRRAFNDGSGLMAASPRYFREGDYGHHLLAHEAAHIWWGGTVSERWLAPGSGGQWLVEGLATMSAALATETRFGSEGLARVKRANFFDPDRQGVIQEMSYLDNALAIGKTRDTIYRKGGYAALMLREVIGADAFAAGLREFVATQRYQQATDGDLQIAMERASGVDLAEFFEEWIRSDRLPDFALERRSDGKLEVMNRGRLPILPALDVRTVDSDGAVTVSQARVGDTVPSAPDGGHVVVNADLAWADVWLDNNRAPRLQPPLVASAAAPNRVAILHGSGRPWERSSVVLRDAAGTTVHTIDFDRGVVSRPRWAPDGERVVFAVARAKSDSMDIVSVSADGKRRRIGQGHMPIPTADGGVIAVDGDSIIHIDHAGRTKAVAEIEDWQLDKPVLSPSGRFLLYEAAHRSRLQLRSRDLTTDVERILFEGERDWVAAQWSKNEDAVFAIVGHAAAWRVVRLPLGEASPTVIADDVASIAAMALSPGGTQLALVAASIGEVYPDPTHVLYLIDLRTQKVKRTAIEGHDVRDAAWLDADQLLIVARQIPASNAPRLPEDRSLFRLSAVTGDLSPYP